MSEWRTTVGLEIHAELHTATKMFCNSKNDPDETRPNVNVCPVCMAHPGSLPVVNKHAVHSVLRVGAALGSTLADYTEFDRKNYFYPDIPKGYQISQYEFPLVKGGSLNGVAITRVHLEEDTANSKHVGDYSYLDFNRAGVPLMELVTEPVIHDATTASAFAKELQLLLRTLGVSEANMDKGQMRLEANISVSRDEKLGTKVEVKNLNSFRSVERAIEYEVKRHIELIESGGTVTQETRGFDEATGKTFFQRKKENSNDYRYFPDPDIPKFKLSLINEFSHDELMASLPELPQAKRTRYAALGLKEEDIEVLVSDELYGAFYDEEVSSSGDAKLALLGANYLMNDVRASGAKSEELARMRGGSFTSLMKMLVADEISSRGAKDILTVLMSSGGDPRVIATEKGLMQVTDTAAIQKIVDEVVAENAAVFAEFKAGKQAVAQFLVGKVMAKSKGSAKPNIVHSLLTQMIS